MEKNTMSATMLMSMIMILSVVSVKAISQVEASEDHISHLGDLIIDGDQTFTIENSVYTQIGNIFVRESGTLIIKNSTLILDQSRSFEYEFRVVGNARLIVEQGDVHSNYAYSSYVGGHATASISSSSVDRLVFHDASSGVIHESSMLNLNGGQLVDAIPDTYFLDVSESEISSVWCYGNSTVSIYNSDIGFLLATDANQISMYDSTLGSPTLSIDGSSSVQLDGLHAGFYAYWNLFENESVTGASYNLTFWNVYLTSYWRLYCSSNSVLSIRNSKNIGVEAIDNSVVKINNSEVSYIGTRNSPQFFVYDSFIGYLYLHESPILWLINSTCTGISIYSDSDFRIYICWYLDIHVTAPEGQDVPSASVAVYYENGTIADAKLADQVGFARFVLTEKAKKATSEYLYGNYTVTATYETYFDETTVKMAANKQITLTLEGLIFPMKTINELEAKVEELRFEGRIDSKGIAKSLIAKLNTAQKLVDKEKTGEAEMVLESFIIQVHELSGIHMTAEAAGILIKSAEYLLSHL